MRRVIAAILITCAAGTIAFGQTRSNADLDWVAEFKQRALDILMPVDSPDVLAGYRGLRDIAPQDMERYFAVRFSGQSSGFDKNNLSATLVVPVGRSLRLQLLDLHMQHRGASFESVLSRVLVNRISLDVVACRAVRDQMDALSKVRIAVPERDVLAIDPFEHRLVLHVGTLEMDATVSDDANPLVRWAVETNDAFLACAKGRISELRNAS